MGFNSGFKGLIVVHISAARRCECM